MSPFLQQIKDVLMEEGVPRDLFDYIDDRVKELLDDKVAEMEASILEKLSE